MARKDKNNNSSFKKPVLESKDVFNVKENLKKLRSGTGKDGYETESDIQKNQSSNRFYGTSHKEDFSDYSSVSTIDRFDKINDKFNSDISVLKDSFSDHKEKVIEKLSDKVDKADLRWWITGIIAGILFIGGIIYTLSYQDIVSDVKNLNENKHSVNGSLNNIDRRLIQVERNGNNDTFIKKEIIK